MQEPEQKLIDLEKKILRLAQEGDLRGFVDALLEHPVDGRLMRAFAQEEGAPEYAEAMKHIQGKFGVLEAVGHGEH
jgi:hypothetical protein